MDSHLDASAVPQIHPPLDPGFQPSWTWRNAYSRLAAAERRSSPVTVAVTQPGGETSIFRTTMLPAEDRYAKANYRFLERTVKFLLWSRGGSQVLISGSPETTKQIASAYTPAGSRAFDADFIGQRIYLERFQVKDCHESLLPAEQHTVGHSSGKVKGCRIGFDLGGSDRKVAALIDGEVVFSEETAWNPYFQENPKYHEDGIRESIRRAAEYLPRVDAIGGSAAGVYVNNEPRVGSLFRGIAGELFDDHIRPIFKRIAADWNVPIMVANDGDVTALAAAQMLGNKASGGVLGLSLGTSLAAGYVAPHGGLMPWLNELAFVPVDYRCPGPHIDEWSGDAGTGARYHSQQALYQLLDQPNIPDDLPLPEKLVCLQDAAQRGEPWTKQVYESLGVYLGYSLAHFAEFYEFTNVLVLGRVTSGIGGEIILQQAGQVLRVEAPALYEKITFVEADEKHKRHGQAIAAASLPHLATP